MNVRVLVLFEPQTLAQALSQIESIDHLLGSVRAMWLASRQEHDAKRQARDQLCLDNLLDARLRYMAARDAFTARAITEGAA